MAVLHNWDSLKYKFQQCVQNLEVQLRALENWSASNPEEILRVKQAFADSMCSAHDVLNQMKSSFPANDTLNRAHILRCSDKLAVQQAEWSRMYSQLSHEDVSFVKEKKTGSSSLAQERIALVQSIGAIDASLESAVYASEMLKRQKDSISDFGHKLGNITSRVPGINAIVSRITTRQFLERLILSLVVAACMCIVLWMRVLT